MKLINGNTDTEITKISDNSIDLIIADIPWLGDKQGSNDYGLLFDEFSRILYETGTLCIIVDTGSCVVAFLEYCKCASIHFKLTELYCHIEDNRFGNILFVKHREVVGDIINE